MNHYIIYERCESSDWEICWKTEQKIFKSVTEAFEFLQGPEIKFAKDNNRFVSGPFMDSYIDSPVTADMFDQMNGEHNFFNDFEKVCPDGFEDMNKYLESEDSKNMAESLVDLIKKGDDLLRERFIDEGIIKRESSEKCGSQFKEQMKSLERGDIVKHIGNSQTFVVTGNYGGRVTAVATVDITNLTEWELVLKSRDEKPKETERRQEQMDNLRDKLQDRRRLAQWP